MRKNIRWLVGRNLHTKEWTSGGVLEDYPREHWEVYRVVASDHDQAVKVGRAIRAKAQALTTNQKSLLTSIFAEIDDTSNVDVNTRLVELEASEIRVAKALAEKGLVTFQDDAQVTITFNGLNLWCDYARGLSSEDASVESESRSADRPRCG